MVAVSQEGLATKYNQGRLRPGYMSTNQTGRVTILVTMVKPGYMSNSQTQVRLFSLVSSLCLLSWRAR